eukprot:SAG22_NODE_201_length_15391_cov_7.662176_1_plen_570_part_00
MKTRRPDGSIDPDDKSEKQPDGARRLRLELSPRPAAQLTVSVAHLSLRLLLLRPVAVLAQPCRCTGATWPSELLTSLGLPTDYGTSCHAWEDGNCSAHSCGAKTHCDTMWPGVSLGTWCCRSWCYVDPETCQMDDVSGSAIQGGGWEGDMQFFSYDACDAAPTTYANATCPWSRELDFTSAVSLCRETALNNRVEVLLLQDLSGSYNDDIERLHVVMEELGPKLAAQFGEPYIGVASYVDHPGHGGRALEYCYRLAQPLSSNFSAVKTAYQNLQVLGGGDAPESQLDGIVAAVTDPNVGWSYDSGTTRVVLLTSDAPFHSMSSVPRMSRATTAAEQRAAGCPLGQRYSSEAEVKSALEENDIQVVFAVTDNAVHEYEALACRLGRGQVISLSTDSSNIMSVISEGVCVLTPVNKVTVKLTFYGSNVHTVRANAPGVMANIVGVTESSVVTTSVWDFGQGDGIESTFTVMMHIDASTDTAAQLLQDADLLAALQHGGVSPLTAIGSVRTAQNAAFITAESDSDLDCGRLSSERLSQDIDLMVKMGGASRPLGLAAFHLLIVVGAGAMSWI